jgi:hypothetical protein
MKGIIRQYERKQVRSIEECGFHRRGVPLT